MSLYARDVGILTPRMRGVVDVGSGSMLLAQDMIDGTSLDGLEDDQVTDDIMRGAKGKPVRPKTAGQKRYIDAIREAQEKLLREDDRVFLYGQDIATFGGAFKATKGLAEQFPNRVFDAPISEDAMIGMAVGAAIEGMRPIVEMQFADFSSVAFNQIVNQAATHFYRTGVPIPITVRLPSGGTPGSGPFHSQSMEGIYAQYPGLVVLTPATVSDAYHMLIDGVALDDPVIFCEHKFLYRWLKAKSINGDHLPIGQARITRPGKHATVVAYSAMVHEAVRAADRLQQDGWEIEVVDLRSVKPLDVDTILASVARTGRLLAVGEAFPWGGVTAEVIARIASHLRNARMVAETQAAADAAGDAIVAVDDSGRLSWATPLAQTWLASVCDADHRLPPSLLRWLACGDAGSPNFSLQGDGQRLSFAKLGPRRLLVQRVETVPEPETLARLMNITAREADVLYWMVLGKTNPEIAGVLEMSPRTVNKHLEHIFTKLGVETRTAAATVALNRSRLGVVAG